MRPAYLYYADLITLSILCEQFLIVEQSSLPTWGQIFPRACVFVLIRSDNNLSIYVKVSHKPC
jgi:hypothetical protein